MSTRLAFDRVAGMRGGRMLFAGVSFALEAGDAAIVAGPNGIGKSSLIRIAAGLLAPAAGAIGREGRLALLAEAAALDGDRTVTQALAFWARLDGAGDSRERAADTLTAVALEPLADVPVRLLSTGQRRRIGFARVVASGAAIWLLDEPANGLDTAAVARLEARIAAHRESGGIALVATHQPLDLPRARTIGLERHVPTEEREAA